MTHMDSQFIVSFDDTSLFSGSLTDILVVFLIFR